MPALPDVSKVLKVALIFTDGINTDIVTRFYIQYSGSAPGNADADAYASSVHAEFASSLAADMNEALSLITVEVTDLSTVSSAVGTWSGVEPGTATDDPVPIDNALVSSYIIGRRYRGGHPRGYWPLGQATNLQTPQTWTSAFISGVHNDLNDFFTNIRADGWSGSGTLTHVNVSYYTGFTVVTDPLTGRARNVPTLRGTPLIDAITSRIERIRIGVQRRRLQY